MDDYSPYDLASAFESAIKAARRSGSVRYVVQNAMGYYVHKELKLPIRYNAWKINADGSVADSVMDKGYKMELIPA